MLTVEYLKHYAALCLNNKGTAGPCRKVTITGHKATKIGEGLHYGSQVIDGVEFTLIQEAS